MKKLHHETCESFKSSWYAYGRRDLDKDTLGSRDVNLELASFVDRRVQQGEEALFRLS